jgi:hypothetical protein
VQLGELVDFLHYHLNGLSHEGRPGRVG